MLEEAVVLMGNIADTVEASALHKVVSIRSKSVNYICSVGSAERDARANEPTLIVPNIYLYLLYREPSQLRTTRLRQMLYCKNDDGTNSDNSKL